MTQRRLVVAGICLVLGMGVCVGMAVGSEGDLEAINKVREMEAAALNNADPSLSAMIYTADVVSVPPGEPAVQGVDAAREWLAGMLEQFDGHLEYTSSEVTILGDWAFETYTATATLTPRDGGDALVEHARGIHIYRRGADGAWKIARDVWNYDAPGTD